MPANAYVYVVHVNRVARYIGKGTGSRLLAHQRIARRLLRRRDAKAAPVHKRLAVAILFGCTVEIEVIAGGLTEAAAFDLEQSLISACSSGELWNTLPGGLGGSSQHSRMLWEREDFRQKQLAKWLDDDVRRRHRASVAASISEEARRSFGRRVAASWRDPSKCVRRLAELDSRNRERKSRGLPERVLAAIMSHDGPTYRQISDAIGAAKINRAIFKLKKRGLIEKRGGKHDGRFFLKSAEYIDGETT